MFNIYVILSKLKLLNFYLIKLNISHSISDRPSYHLKFQLYSLNRSRENHSFPLAVQNDGLTIRELNKL